MADPRPSSAPGRRPRAVAWIVWTSVVALLYVVLRVDGPFSALDFPLNDDWAFARTVLTLLQTGRFELTEWVGMAFVPQALWGAGVSSLVGFSFNTLRVSVLILAAACLAIFEPWMRSFGIERRQAGSGPACSASTRCSSRSPTAS